MKIEDIHIGSIIKKKVKEKGLTVSGFARAIHCSRANVHSIFERKSLDTELLIRISNVLSFNFLLLYNESKNNKYFIIIESDKAFLEELLSYNFIKVLGFYKV